MTSAYKVPRHDENGEGGVLPPVHFLDPNPTQCTSLRLHCCFPTRLPTPSPDRPVATVPRRTVSISMPIFSRQHFCAPDSARLCPASCVLPRQNTAGAKTYFTSLTSRLTSVEYTLIDAQDLQLRHSKPSTSLPDTAATTSTACCRILDFGTVGHARQSTKQVVYVLCFDSSHHFPAMGHNYTTAASIRQLLAITPPLTLSHWTPFLMTMTEWT